MHATCSLLMTKPACDERCKLAQLLMVPPYLGPQLARSGVSSSPVLVGRNLNCKYSSFFSMLLLVSLHARAYLARKLSPPASAASAASSPDQAHLIVHQQVSYASTGTALSDKSLYDLFARTVPSDMFQARAIADIVQRLNWSYVSLVSSEGLYGDSGSKEFMKQAQVRQICIATHEKISPTTGNEAYESIVDNLVKRNATGVVLFTRAEDTRELLLAVQRKSVHKPELLRSFAWVAADGWGTHQKLVEGVEEVAWGAITVELQAKAIPGFDQYMKALTPWSNERNPWFSEYWQEWFNCQLQVSLLHQQQVASFAARRQTSGWPESELAELDAPSEMRRRSLAESSTGSISSSCTNNSSCSQTRLVRSISSSAGSSSTLDQPSGSTVKQLCSPNLRISEDNGYRQEQKVQFVVDAVYAMAHALHKAWFSLCDAQPGLVCEALKELNGESLSSELLPSKGWPFSKTNQLIDKQQQPLNRRRLLHALPAQRVLQR